jgi:hypothetical protein
LVQRLPLDLPHTFPRQAHAIPDGLERLRRLAGQTETQTNHGSIARLQAIHQLQDLLQLIVQDQYSVGRSPSRILRRFVEQIVLYLIALRGPVVNAVSEGRIPDATGRTFDAAGGAFYLSISG